MVKVRLLTALMAWGTVTQAQVVRGTVTDAVSGAPLAGVVISLDAAAAAASSLAYTVLSDERGQYAVRAPAAGRYVLAAKRVGRKRFASSAFALGTGESRRLDFALEPVDFTLPTVAIRAETPCTIEGADRGLVASLWDEARTALTASQLSLRDRLFRATMVRYVRELRPTNLQVLREESSARHGVTERPYRSLPAANLSDSGFVRDDGLGFVFYGPDADVLTSSEFLRDHCFAVARDPKRRGGQLGLAFVPVQRRKPGEISGTMWVDSASAELRLVEFTYLNLPAPFDRVASGGEVTFGQAPNGVWYVTRWFIRMPTFAGVAAISSPIPGADGQIKPARYREEGGDVTIDGALSVVRGARLTGVAMDSLGDRPLRSATVRLSGTRHTATTRFDGSFSLDSVAGGAYTLLLEHPAYAALGVFAAEQDLEIAENSQSVTALKAIGMSQVIGRLCGTSTIEGERAALRVNVRGDSGLAVPKALVVVRYHAAEVGTDRVGLRPTTVELESDERGAATFCELPSRLPLEIRVTLPGSDNPVTAQERLIAGTIRAITVAR